MNIHSSNLPSIPVPSAAGAAVADLVTRYGSLRVLLLVLVAVVRPHRRIEHRSLATLTEHLRRDIGLPPRTPIQPRHWSDIR